MNHFGMTITFHPSDEMRRLPSTGSVWRVTGQAGRFDFNLEPAPELEDLRRRLDEALAAAKRHKADADAARTREFELRAELERLRPPTLLEVLADHD